MNEADIQIIHLEDIKACLLDIDLIPIIERGFVSYASGQAVIPPVGELQFYDPPGEMHIKYGYIKEEDYAVVKIASGFYQNPAIGISSSQGLMLLFSQQTGQLRAVLLDDGYLTDVRTVIASMITIKHLAPSQINAVGIIGTGIQAKMHLEYLPSVTDCQDIYVWARSAESKVKFEKHAVRQSLNITVTQDMDELTEVCNCIISATPSQEPLLIDRHVRSGMHITALGSDTAHKQEIDSHIVNRADVVVSDSLSQSQSRGEIHQARMAGLISDDQVVELGALIKDQSLGRSNEKQITIADLTGVAVQDIMIATAIYNQHQKKLSV